MTVCPIFCRKLSGRACSARSGKNTKRSLHLFRADKIMFTLLKTQGKARRGRMETVHGVIETPVFMNVGTSGAIRGGLSAFDLRALGCQVELSNTYHLHIRPGDQVIKELGGLHRFMNWSTSSPTLTAPKSSWGPSNPCRFSPT